MRLQRQRKILYTRLKVPPSINQFRRHISKDQLNEVSALLKKYTPPTRAEKKAALQKKAEAANAGADTAEAPKLYTQFGINHVTNLIEKKKAKLVLIAGDVDPIELVVWLPALCRKMEVPYMIVASKALLGTHVHQKNATCLALTDVRKEDATKLSKLADLAKTLYNNNTEALRAWGGGIMGAKTRAKLRQRSEIEAAARRIREAL